MIDLNELLQTHGGMVVLWDIVLYLLTHLSFVSSDAWVS